MSRNHEMNRRPSLPAIRAFEAAARLRSFTRAAEELQLTQSAVSRHVRSIEDEFGVPLFDREGRAVKLTEAGLAYFSSVNEGLRMVYAATNAMRREHRRKNSLTISMLPSVAALWFAPYLTDFTEAHPEIDLRIHAERRLVDLSRDDVDLCVRYGQGDWQGVLAEPLTQETLTPVCAPETAERFNLAAGPHMLRNVQLLGDDLVDGWRAWLAAADVPLESVRFGPRFNETTTLYRSAAAGVGVALGRSLLVAREVADGRLVAPFALDVPASYAYWLVCLPETRHRVAVEIFIEWVKRIMEKVE